MKQRPDKAFFALMTILVLMMTLMVFAAPTAYVFIAPDFSGSMRGNPAIAKQTISLTAYVAVNSAPSGSEMNVLGFSGQGDLRSFWSGPAPHTIGELAPVIKELKTTLPRAPGTFSAQVVRFARLQTDKYPGKPLGLALVSDGLFDDPTDFGKEIQALAGKPVVILVVGIAPEARPQMLRLLAPLGDRVVVRGFEDVPGGVRNFRKRLQGLTGGGQ